jgi:hypothetical protein
LKGYSFTTFVLIALMSASALAQGPGSRAAANPRQDGSSAADRVAACPLAELVLDPERRVSATVTSNGFVLEVRAELHDGQVISSVSVDGGRIVTSLAIPEGERIVPSLDGLVIEAGRVATKQLAAADVATGARRVALVAAYDDMAQTLFEATPALGNTQLRYALMYHTSVVRTAYRLLDAKKADVVSVCTPSHEYLYGVAAFRCSEDYAGAAALSDIIRPRDGNRTSRSSRRTRAGARKAVRLAVAAITRDAAGIAIRFVSFTTSSVLIATTGTAAGNVSRAASSSAVTPAPVGWSR